MPTDTELLQLAIVAPCYNEEAVLPFSVERLIGLLGEMEHEHACGKDSYIVLVDDGSRDRTWEIIEKTSDLYPGKIKGIKLACNAGHQSALMAGLNYVSGRCDAVISIDADLQDDLDALPKMISEHRAGAEIVLGVKVSRESDSAFKKITANIFYKLMRCMGVDLTENHADCRLMSAKVLENLSQFPEKVLFLRGLQPLLHNKVAIVKYNLHPRLAGVSKYPLGKMLALAWNGITSFSVVPLRIISWLGALVSLIAFSFAVYALIEAFRGNVMPGWASVTVPLYMLGGVIMLSVGVVGEYVGKIYIEVKGRPRYLIDEILD